jgi:uncharacterized protein
MLARVGFSLLAGSLFGAGLAISGMADPQRVQSFLDFLGHWDPTLVFVMGGALIPMIGGWMLLSQVRQPLAGGSYVLPNNRAIDTKLIAGSVLFGVGWGASGLCPGPAVAGLAVNPIPAFVFLSAMVAGMAFSRIRLGVDPKGTIQST